MKSLIFLSLVSVLAGCAQAPIYQERPGWKPPQCIVIQRYVGETREQAREKAAIIMSTEPPDSEAALLIRQIVEIQNAEEAKQRGQHR